MANILFQAHSGLRFLVLLAGVVAAAVLLWGWSSRRPYTGQSRTVTAVFTGLLGLQFLLGIGTVLTRPWYGALIGHLVMMFAAIGVAQGLTGYARRQADARRAHMISLIGVLLALALIVGGIMAIRNSPFQVTAGRAATAPR
jgi:drug/metabolite transporter (DMT)-like permease